MTETGEVINESFSFDNNDSGFELLLDVLKSLDQSQNIKIGLEATGHYGNNLKLFLIKNNYGSGHLRYVLMNTAMTIIIHNPTFYSYYSKKHQQEGKNHRVALSHVVRKLVRIIYHLEVNNQDFNSNLLK